MNVTELVRKAEKLLSNNSPAILTAFGVSGTITTAYLAAKASYEIGSYDHAFHQYPIKTKAKLCWKKYIPTGISGVLTIGCIIGGTTVSLRRTAAAYSLLSVSEKAFTEYKEKVVEQIGERKEKGIRDQIAQDRVTNNPTSIISGPGDVLCYEMHTGRYFKSDMEKLRRAQNDINAKCLREDEASLSDFYYILGVQYTSHSSSTGWTSDKLMELSFSTVLADDGRPCLAFEYNYVKKL